MMRHPMRVRDYLEHMVEALRRVAEYTAGMSESEFLSKQLVQDGVIRNFEILGEAANNCVTEMPDIAFKYPGIPFAQIYGLRNQLSHGYTTIDLSALWGMIRENAPELRDHIAVVLNSLGDSVEDSKVN